MTSSWQNGMWVQIMRLLGYMLTKIASSYKTLITTVHQQAEWHANQFHHNDLQLLSMHVAVSEDQW